MKTSTERLRALLDERGVEWYEPLTKPNKTWFPDENGINCSARPWGDTLEIKRHGLTPEQAIAVTLGSGKLTAEQVEEIVNHNCKFYEGGEIDAEAIADELNDTLGRGTCHADKKGNCSECGEFILKSWEYARRFDGEPVLMGKHAYNYCPNCGRKVVSA